MPLFTQSFVPFSTSCWGHFFSVHHAGVHILDHPDYQPDGPSTIVYDDPVLDVSTGAYKVSQCVTRGSALVGFARTKLTKLVDMIKF